MTMNVDTRKLSLAARIKIARVGRDWDQVQLAAAIGTSRGSVSNWELGKHEPKLSDAVKLANATGVSLEWLADGVAGTEKAPAVNDEGQVARPEGFEPPTFWSVVCEGMGLADDISVIFEGGDRIASV